MTELSNFGGRIAGGPESASAQSSVLSTYELNLFFKLVVWTGPSPPDHSSEC